jgi:hypothetical protein
MNDLVGDLDRIARTMRVVSLRSSMGSVSSEGVRIGVAGLCGHGTGSQGPRSARQSINRCTALDAIRVRRHVLRELNGREFGL